MLQKRQTLLAVVVMILLQGFDEVAHGFGRETFQTNSIVKILGIRKLAVMRPYWCENLLFQS